MYTLILTLILWRGGVTISTTHGWSQHDCQMAAQTWLAANKPTTNVEYVSTAVCVPGGPDGDVRITR